MNNVQLTVFTPSYNRAKLLSRCYEGMKSQTNKSFIWMIIDDGSTDNTRELVKKWMQEESEFEIQYFYKENGGLHTAYNKAIENISTDLCVCIDSDDWMPDDAVEKIVDFWKQNGTQEYAGIVGLDYTENGIIVGDLLPNIKSINLIDLLIGKYSIRNGDRTNVLRTELYKKFAPMKEFKGEKNFNPHYMHLQISQEYDFLVMNENLRFVEYQSEGMSNSIIKQYKNSPNSFFEIRKLYLSFDNAPIKFKIRNTIHWISSSILSHRIGNMIKENPHKIITILCIPLGILLTLYVKWKG